MKIISKTKRLLISILSLITLTGCAGKFPKETKVGEMSIQMQTIDCIFTFTASFILTYYFVALVQTVFHKLFGHKNRIKAIYETHALGHHDKYRPSKLLTDSWIDSERHVMWYYAIPTIPISLLVFYSAPLSVIVGFSSSLLISIWWHIFLHEQYHIKNSFFERYKWFLKKRKLHFDHHIHVNKNYAIVEYWIDDLMGTKVTNKDLLASKNYAERKYIKAIN